MKNTKDFVDELYEKVAAYHGLTVAEVRRITTTIGTPLVHQYYVGTYGEDFI